MAGEAEAAAIRAVGAAKAEAYRQGIEALGAGGYTAMQLAAILGEHHVKLVPDIAIRRRVGRLVDVMVARMLAARLQCKSAEKISVPVGERGPTPRSRFSAVVRGRRSVPLPDRGCRFVGMDPRSFRDLPRLARANPGMLF